MTATAPGLHVDDTESALIQFIETTGKPGEGWDHPDHAFNATGSLTRTAQALSRAIENTGALIGRLDLGDRLTHDHGQDSLNATTDEVRNLAKEAADQADELARTLKHLENALIPLGLRA